jgi:hypothetical protein
MGMLAALAFLAISVAPVSYRIDLKGGGAYWSNAKPAEKSGRYVFTTPDGTLLSIRKSDVSQVKLAPRAPGSNEEVAFGPTSPAAAAKNHNVAQTPGPRPKGRALTPTEQLLSQEEYRPGIGLAYPAAPGDYQVGKTFAYPMGDVREGGAPPANVQSGEPPMLRSPTPPPPPPPPPPPKR